MGLDGGFLGFVFIFVHSRGAHIYGQRGKYALSTNAQQIPSEGDTGLDESHSKQEHLEQSLHLLNTETRAYFQNVIKEETKWNEMTTEAEKVDTLHKYSEALLSIIQFERIHNLIYGSQIRLL